MNSIISFIMTQTAKYNIDESHSLNHALNVLDYSKKIYDDEVILHPKLENQQHIIYTSALIHDTCDSKYMNEKSSIDEITTFLDANSYSHCDIENIINIITSMSYHKIKQNGFPSLADCQEAFHIVREADLLASFDFNRAILYALHRQNLSYIDSFYESKNLYYNRMDKLVDDNLFLTSFGKQEALVLGDKAKKDIENIENIIKMSF